MEIVLFIAAWYVLGCIILAYRYVGRIDQSKLEKSLPIPWLFIVTVTLWPYMALRRVKK